MNAFDIAIAFTLKEEGGYVDDPRDSGGATLQGVTQGAYDTWRDIQHLPRRDVRGMTDAEKLAIYHDNYWLPGRCDRLPVVVAVAHFDWTVNHGVQGAIKTLQQTLGFTGDDVDGMAGPKTFMAMAEVTDSLAFASAYTERRRQWYRDRVVAKPDQAAFLPGWLGRCDRLVSYCNGIHI